MIEVITIGVDIVKGVIQIRNREVISRHLF